MANRLALIRHAKAEDGRVDERRALTSHGKSDARAIGRWLREHDVVPALALVSPALRTVQTWEAIADELGDTDVPVTLDERIYDNRVAGLVAMVEECDDETSTVAVVGHNPSMHALASQLAGDADSAQLSDYPTATVAVFTVQSWLRLEAARLTAISTCRG
ncbi:MAG TPA: histidine phosphatase family protein [Mycobacteriales bacterium]|nr:histidine phosphatase family protein [Mycobacteriales bacterium]